MKLEKDLNKYNKEELLDLSTRYDKYNEMILSRQK